MKSKVLKVLFSVVIVMFASVAAYADSVSVKKNGKVIGDVTYSYEVQTTYKGGAFVHIKATNNTKEDVSVTFKTDKGGSIIITLNGYETKEEIMGLNDVPSKVYSVTDYVVAR